MGRGRRPGRGLTGAEPGQYPDVYPLLGSAMQQLFQTARPPQSARAVEVAPGVFFMALQDAYGADEAALDQGDRWDAYLVAVEGMSCLDEAVWDAVEEINPGYLFLGGLAVFPDAEVRLEQREIVNSWEQISQNADAVHRVWVVRDDQSDESPFALMIASCPRLLDGLKKVDHLTAAYWAAEGRERAEAIAADESRFAGYLPRLRRQRALREPQHPRARTRLSPLAS